MEIISEHIALNGKQLASYSIVYCSNYVADIMQLSDLVSKSQVRATEFESFYQQNNLIHIDMLFPNVLADIALEVYFGRVFNFDDYLRSTKSYQIIDIETDKLFFNSRINRFIEYLLYSDIASIPYSTAELNHSLLYKLDDGVHVLCFNSVNYTDLIQIALQTIELRIDLNKSYTTIRGEVILNLVIEYEKGPMFK